MAGVVLAQGRAARLGGTSPGPTRSPGRMMPVDDFHRRVAIIALGAAAKHGFALGGGSVLIKNRIIDRYTEDVDLFTDQEAGVETASDEVEAALREVGLETERRTRRQDLPTFSR